MISLEKLNDQSVEEILDDARDEIVYLSDKWTDFQEADPGITLIELFSWLTYGCSKSVFKIARCKAR